MAFYIGSFLGGFAIIWLLSMLAYRITKADAPLTPVIIAWLVVGSLASFGMMDGGPWHWQAFFYYVPSAVAVWAFMQWRESKASELEDIFE